MTRAELIQACPLQIKSLDATYAPPLVPLGDHILQKKSLLSQVPPEQPYRQFLKETLLDQRLLLSRLIKPEPRYPLLQTSSLPRLLQEGQLLN